MKRALFVSLLVYIAAVSLFDGWLVVWNPSIRCDERNALGLYLMNLQDGHPWIFLRCKAAGTLTVIAALWFLKRRWQPAADWACTALAMFQTGLLVELAR